MILRVLCILLLLSSSAWARMGPMVAGGGAVAVAGYPDVIFYWSCDSTTANKSAGDTSASAQAGATISTSRYQQGTGSVAVDGAYRRFEFTLNNDDLADMETGRIGMWVYVDSTITGGSNFIRLYYDSNNYVRLYMFSTNRIYFDYMAGGSGPQYVGTSNNAFANDEWVFVEFAWNKGGAGNDFQIFVNGSSVSSDDTVSGTWSKGASGVLSIGDDDGNASAANNYNIDNIIISNDPTRDLYAIRNTTSF